jgi:hypothetical protein
MVGMGSWGSIVGNLFVEKDKGKAGMGSYLHMGPFILALDSFYGLTSNFIMCLEQFLNHFPLLMLFLLIDKHRP